MLKIETYLKLINKSHQPREATLPVSHIIIFYIKHNISITRLKTDNDRTSKEYMKRNIHLLNSRRKELPFSFRSVKTVAVMKKTIEMATQKCYNKQNEKHF